jgi:hypothetical protein
MNWRTDIEYAPRDKHILLFNSIKNNYALCFYDSDCWFIAYSDNDQSNGYQFYPTHWCDVILPTEQENFPTVYVYKKDGKYLKDFDEYVDLIHEATYWDNKKEAGNNFFANGFEFNIKYLVKATFLLKEIA